MKKNKPLTHQQIIQMLISPRAALDRLYSSGKIDYDDLGALQCVQVLAIQIDNHSNVEAPDIDAIKALTDAIEKTGEVTEEMIDDARNWLTKYQNYLRRVSAESVRQAVAATNKLIAQS